jgi:NitT/TauT family transport system substrate-binding protein
MRADRRTLTWVVAIAAAVVALAAGIVIYRSIASRGASSKPLVWGGPTNISMLPIIADQQGFFRAEGLDVRPNYLQTGKVAMDAVVSGDLNFGVIVETNVAFVKFQEGADVKVIASVMRKHDDAIMARRDRGIQTPKNIEGKTLALVPGTTSHRFADLFIDFYKLDRKKIQFLSLTAPSIQASVLNGSIPAGSVWEPYRYNVQQALDGKLVQFNDPRIYTAYGLVAVRGDFAKAEPARIRSFLKALIRAEAFVRDHRDEAIAILAKELGMDPAVLTAIWGSYELNVQADEGLVNVFVSTGQWAKSTQKGLDNKPVPAYTDVLDLSFLRRVDAARVTPAAK